MFSSSFNIIQPLPRFNTIRFGRRIEIDDDDDEKNREYKTNQVILPRISSTNEDNSSSILLTGIRNCDWNFYDESRDINQTDLPNIKYKLIPSINNTIKNQSNFIIENNQNQYEEYDLDEEDFQWLIAYNQFRIEKNLPELDENIFEYIMQLFEHQCLLAIREKNYHDTIQCDACHRIDDIDDLIQCIQCKTIVHKKCYHFDENINQWTCFSCQYDNEQHQCYICDKTGGALKLFELSSDKFKWIHLTCAFWLPNFDFDEKMTPILKHPLDCDGRCSICYKKTGVKLNCCWKNCQDRFHPKCAIDAGQDMLIAENDDKYSIHLLALCDQHTEKLDIKEKQIRLNKFLETKQKRFEQFPSYINLDTIQTQTLIPLDILESIHTYWVLKRQANNCRPLIDLPDDIFYHDYDKNLNLIEFSRQYHRDHQSQTTDLLEDKPNALQFLVSNRIQLPLEHQNLFAKYAQFNRRYFINYERNRFCLLDSDKKNDRKKKV